MPKTLYAQNVNIPLMCYWYGSSDAISGSK